MAYFTNDIDVLNYALTLEHLESAFYKMAVSSGMLQGNALSYLTIIGSHEDAHVTGLTQAISNAGGTPVKARASYDFTVLGDPTTQVGLLKIASILEPTGVGAYDGAAPDIQNKDYLATAGSIVQVEARHAAIVRALLDPNANPVPDAFAPSLTPQDVLKAVTPVLGPEQ
ncbi:MAG TPA: ferritin-like domain-containing protein [Nitrolancea sp.]|jgi:hypothetical protein|nr:ferritin-like domain-containing protein [Nitrolancea sp.]